jgi:hypothetical protein
MNFTNTAVPFNKKPLFPGYEGNRMSSQPKRSVSFLTLFIVIISTFALAFILFKNFDRITNLFSSAESTT